VTTRLGWPGRARSRGRSPVVGCDQATEAVSARLDRERLPLAEADLDLHLAHCEGCRDYETAAVALVRRARLREPRAVPGDLVARLAPLLEPAPRGLPGLVARGRRGRRPRVGWATAQWAGAMVPAAIAVVAISLGAGSSSHLVPTRPPSPCTIGLVARHGHGPR
jgi:predicted anti-sigma-YlaC factor YlaD